MSAGVVGDARPVRRRTLGWVLAVVAAVALMAAARAVLRPSAPDLPLATVTRGDFVERVEMRGEVRPVRSALITAPSSAGDLIVVKLVKSGTMVRAGDAVATFDPVSLRQQIDEKRAEVRTAGSEADRARAQAVITNEQNRTALVKAGYDVERAALAMGDADLRARLDVERARLDLVNAQQRYREIEERANSARLSAQADLERRARHRERLQDQLDRLERSLAAMDVLAPADGMVHVMLNNRTTTPGAPMQEFREGDRAWAGAPIAELPDLSSVFVRARLDEDTRGRLEVGQPALVRIDAIPDRELRASVSEISVLARVEMGQGFPPPRNFDLKVRIDETDERLRPGMSATARIEVDRLSDTLLVPAGAVFEVNGRPVVYRLVDGRFEETPIEVAKRSHEQVAVASGLTEGIEIASERPALEYIRSAR
jgi:RND family efflux transporter MFP subunit